jgi:hypothetical protein
VKRVVPAFLALATAVSCSSGTAPVVFPPSVTLRVQLPAEIRPLLVEHLEIRLQGVGGPPPSVVVGGAQVGTVTADGGALEVAIRIDQNPFLSSRADILLQPAPGSATGLAAPAFTVQATGSRGDNVVLAAGSAAADTTGQPIRFNTGDLFVDLPLSCVLAGGCAEADAGPTDGGADAGVDAGPPADAGPTPITVAGQLLDRAGEPLSPGRVLLGSAAKVVGADGGFTYANITPPYTLTAMPGGAGPAAAVSWAGVATAAPRAALPFLADPDGGVRTASVSARVYVYTTYVDGEAVIAARGFETVTGFPLVSKRQEKVTPVAGLYSSYTLGPVLISWQGTATTDVVLLGAGFSQVAQGDPDAGPPADGGPTRPSYNWVTVTRGVLSDGVETQLNGSVANISVDRVVTVNATGASSLAVRRYFPLVEVGGIQLSLPGSPQGGYDSPEVPIINGSQLAQVCPACVQYVRVTAMATDCAGRGQERTYAVAHSGPIAATDTTVSVTLLDPPAIGAPASAVPLDGGGFPDAGTGVASPARYSLRGDGGFDTYLGLLLQPGHEESAHSLFTAASSGTYPDLRNLDAGLPLGIYGFYLLSLKVPGLSPQALLEAGQVAVALPDDFCSSRPPLGYSPGTAATVQVRIVELRP